jgi:uncharacterized membrane protein YphA (DoxX/SURF4 family)
MGISLLVYPTRAIAGWLVIWGIMTASLRPLSGEPFAEFIERAGNYGVPLTLLILCGINGKWFRFLQPDAAADPKAIANVVTCLRITVFLLLTGHGWLNLMEKNGLISQYTSLGFANPGNIARIAGVFEIIAGLSVLIRPIRPILLVFLAWKMGTELFYPHWELFEWVERGGSYGAILALWFALPGTRTRMQSTLSITVT